MLRVINPQKVLKTPSSENVHSPPAPPRYASSTASSRRKAKTNQVAKGDERRRVIHISGEEHTYKNGVPTPFVKHVSDFGATHHYLLGTETSKYRKEILEIERIEKSIEARYLLERRKPRTRRAVWSESESTVVGEWPSFDFLPHSPWFWEKKSDTAVKLLEAKTRLHDSLGEAVDLDLIRTESKTNLSYLQQAARTVQKSIWDAWMGDKLVGRQRCNYVDGPHLIALGRDELHEWLDRDNHDPLAQNGYSGSQVYYAIINVVWLRNVISHPRRHELRHPFEIDRMLSRAQYVCVVLGDEDGAQEVRGLRDALYADTEADRQWILDMHSLISMPDAVVPDFPSHHVEMFEDLLRYEWDYYGPEKQKRYGPVYELGLRWKNQRTE